MLGSGKISPKEIARLAMSVEEEGIRFYRHCMAISDSPEAKKVFQFLVKEETAHYEYFGSLAEAADAEAVSGVSRLKDSYLEKVKEAMRSALFGAKEMGQKDLNLTQALRMAIRAEKEAVRVYTDMLPFYASKTQEMLKRIIEEESRHLKVLLDLRSK